MAKTSTSNKKKVVKVDTHGQAHISSTFNNVIVTLTNSEGQVISWSSAGKMGFRGSKRIRRMQLKRLRPIVQKSHTIWDYVK